MQNLWVFLFRNRAFFWFLAFEFLSFFFIFRYNPYQGGLYFNNANRIIGGIYQKKAEVQSYLSLKNTNQSLAEENAQLRKLLNSSLYSVKSNQKTIKDSINKQQYTFTVAKVVNNSTTRRNNYLTLDKGKLAGIVPGDGVIFPKGIVGVVMDVSDHYCTVLSILHEKSRISVRVKKTKNIGSMYWDGFNSEILSVNDIPNFVDVKQGDTIETSGFSLFPMGIPIGTIQSSGNHNGESSLSIKIKLMADLNKLDEVYIVNNKFSLEKKSLEDKSLETN